MLNVDRTFVMHYSPLTERRVFLQSLLDKSSLQAEWIEEEPDNFNDFYDFSTDEWNKKIKPFYYGAQILPRKLKKSELSLAYKHIKVFKKIIDNNINSSLIFEDDVYLINNFSSNFNKCLEQTPKDWDFIFIGSGCNLRIPSSNKIKNKIAYLKEHPASKCTDSYVISNKAAKKLLKSMLKITLPIDFELNYQMWLNNFKVYWWEPPIVMQGSQCNLFESKIQ